MPDKFGFENEKYDIIMFNMSSWYDWDHGIVNRNYNILHTLAEEKAIHRIISVDFFPLSWKKAAKHYVQNILLETRHAEMVYGDLTSACYQKTDKIYVYSSIDSMFSWKTVARELRRIEKTLNLRNVIFWSYNPCFTEFIGTLNEKLFVFDAVDNWSLHPTYTKFVSKKKLLKNYETIATKADLIFTVSDELKEFYQGMGRSSDLLWVPNGVNYKHFNDDALINQKTVLDDIKEPIIGYLGTIEERFDIDLVIHLAKNNPDKKIALCGPVWAGVETELNNKIKGFNNIILTGRVPYSASPAYLNKFAVAIMPHLVNDFVKSMNPMKIYEYLACGKPIVSTRVSGVDMFPEFISVANNYSEFDRLVKEAITTDSIDLQTKRREAAKAHSWRSRVDQMITAIQSKVEWPLV